MQLHFEIFYINFETKNLYIACEVVKEMALATGELHIHTYNI